MKIDMIDLRQSDDRKIFNKLQPLIVENLVINGGTLRQANLFDGDYEWTHLFIIKEAGRIIGFAIIRHSSYDQHNTGYEEYYYISDIVMAKEYQGKGYGSELLKTVIEKVDDLPLVASVRDDNVVSLKLFKKLMKAYSEHGRYYRFMDSKYYELRGDTISCRFRL